MSEDNQKEHSRWGEIWRKEEVPGFDTGSPSPALQQLESRGELPVGRALVPGMGRGYDVTFLARPERVVLGVDIVEECIQAAKSRLDSLDDKEVCKQSVQFLKKSFFDLPEEQESDKFDFIYDYTFFCALDPSLRQDWAKKMHALLKEGGELCTLIFPIMPREGGPPFEVSMSLYQEVLEAVGFKKTYLEMLPDELCHKGREGKSALGRWVK